MVMECSNRHVFRFFFWDLICPLSCQEIDDNEKSSSSLPNIPIWGRPGLIGWLLVSSALGFVLLTIPGDHVLSWTNCVQVRFGSNLVHYSELIEGPRTEALETMVTMLDEVVKWWGTFVSHGCDRSWWIWALEVIWTWLYQVLFTFFIKIEQFSFPMLLEDFSRDEVGLINHLKLRNFEIDSSVHVSRHFSPQNSSNLSCCHSFHCEQINSNEPSIIGPDSDNLATVRLAEPGPREWQQDVKVPRVTMSVWKIINSSLDWSHRWSVLEWAVCNPSRCGWIWAWLGGWRMVFQSIMLGAFWWPCFMGWTVCNKMAIQRGNLDSVSEGRPLLEIVTPYRHNSHNLRVGRWKLVGERIYRKTDSRGNLLYHQSCLWWDLR